jgi:mono/diheme cytochrome c family protein
MRTIMPIPKLSKGVVLSLVVVGLWLAAQSVPAQENGRAMTGAALYRQHCAACHGDSGRGDGLVGQALRTPPADLTGLARQHQGVFPSEEVSEFIDGTRYVLPHGARAMPVWGMMFQSRETIRKIVDYLRELQQP